MKNTMFRSFYKSCPGIKSESMAYTFWCAAWDARMKASNTLLEKEYDGESLFDATRDFCECFDQQVNPEIAKIPVDAHGQPLGTFMVKVVWAPPQEQNQEQAA